MKPAELRDLSLEELAAKSVDLRGEFFTGLGNEWNFAVTDGGGPQASYLLLVECADAPAVDAFLAKFAQLQPLR